jgi:uncharacterized RmlC-like cupin family protein
MSNSATEGVMVVRPGETYVGQQGLAYGSGASLETVGAQKICMNRLPMPSGAWAKAHYHEGIETIAFLLEGECVVYYGDQMECRVVLKKDDQIYIPGGVPHAPCNESDAACTWLVTHSSGSDQDGIVLMPELDVLIPA